MWFARPAGSGFSPLDEELALLPGQLTPRRPESVVRLGSWLPFRQAAEVLTCFTGVTVCEATGRRMTEGGRSLCGRANRGGRAPRARIATSAYRPTRAAPPRRWGNGPPAAPGVGRGQDRGHRGGEGVCARAGGVGRAYRGALLCFAPGGCGDLRALGPCGNAPAGDGDGEDGVGGE